MMSKGDLIPFFTWMMTDLPRVCGGLSPVWLFDKVPGPEVLDVSAPEKQ